MAASETNKSTIAIVWSITSVVFLIAVFVWANSLKWHFSDLSIYQIFPIFGLTAFSVMWSHYVASFLNKTVFKGSDLKKFYNITGYYVLLAIVLHPGLLAFQRFRDHAGVPPGSYLSYVAPHLKWIVLLGEVSLLMFLAFELRRRYKQKSWWRIVVYANDAAMLAIFYHGLRLGNNLHSGWFKVVWLFYGVVLLGIIIYMYAAGYRTQESISGRSD